MNKENSWANPRNGWYIVLHSGYCYELYKDINTSFIQSSHMGSTQKLFF